MKIGIHAGCGPIEIKSDKVQWINFDINESNATDLVLDCTKMVEHFGEDYSDLLISVHMIEHLIYPWQTNDFLSNAYRVLKPGGTLRLVVPDLMKVARKYVAGEDLKDIYGPDFKGYYHKDLPAERFMYFCREWSHQVLFDETLLRSLLMDAGFNGIRVMPFGFSALPELCHLDRFESESLALEAIK